MKLDVRLLTPADEHAFMKLIWANQTRFQKGGLKNLPGTGSYQHFIRYNMFPRAAQEVVMGLFDTDAQRCLGFVGLSNVMVGNMQERGIGIWYGVDEEFEGRGLMTRSVRLALSLAQPHFEGIDLAVIHCRALNRKSARVAEALGLNLDASADYTQDAGSRSKRRLIGYSGAVKLILEDGFSKAQSANAASLHSETEAPLKRRTAP